MMWLTWRQFRAQAVVTAAALAAFAVFLLVTGIKLAGLAASMNFTGCHTGCTAAAGSFVDAANSQIYGPVFDAGVVILYVAPALMGIFWGAPLVTREIEAGTFRLAWNQSVTRTRWLAAKIGLIGLAAMTTAGLLSLMVSWWARPLSRALELSGSQGKFGSSLNPLVFAARGVAPIGYAAFAFVLGAAAGVLIRRMLPAMVVTLAGFAVVQIAWPQWIRPHLITPLQVSRAFNSRANTAMDISSPGNRMTLTASINKPGAWILSNQTVTPSGHLFTGPATQACLGNNTGACMNWIASKHLRTVVTYQPASRFWAFQWLDFGIFLVLAVALGALCAWWLNRRRLA